MVQHSAIVFEDIIVVIADNTFYKLFSGVDTALSRRSTPKAALGYLKSKLKRSNKTSTNQRAGNLYAEINHQLNGTTIKEDQIRFVNSSIPKGIYKHGQFELMIPKSIEREIPKKQPTIIYEGNPDNPDNIEITYDGITFVGDIKVVMDVIVAIHNSNK